MKKSSISKLFKSVADATMRQQRRRRRRDSVRETFLADAKTSSKRQFCRRRVRFEKIIFLSFGHSDSGKKQQLSDLGSWASRRPQRTQNSTGINSDSERRWTENARRKKCDKENQRERERKREMRECEIENVNGMRKRWNKNEMARVWVTNEDSATHWKRMRVYR